MSLARTVLMTDDKSLLDRDAAKSSVMIHHSNWDPFAVLLVPESDKQKSRHR